MNANVRERPAARFAILATLASLLFVARIPASVAVHPLAVGGGGTNLDSSANSHQLVVSTRTEGGAALPGATVRAFLLADRRYLLVATASTDVHGAATWRDLPTGTYWILADAVGRARRSTALALTSASRSVELKLPVSHSLRVRVQDEAHAAVAGATVLVTGVDALPFGALSDVQGQAEVGHLGQGPWKLRVSARGYGTETEGNVTADLTVTLRHASVLDVLVTDESGHPSAGATVLIAGASLWPAREVASDAGGHARITGLEEGAYDLKAQKESLVSRTEVGVHLGRGQTEPVTLVLAQGRSIAVTVTDGDGDHPVVVPDADVWVVEGGVGSFPIRGRTNRFGAVTLGPIARGSAVAAARADGFIARGAVPIPSDDTKEVRVALLRGATLRGTVVDSDGHAVEGATIEVVGTDPDGMPIAATPLAAAFQRAHFEWTLPGPTPLLPAGELGVTLGAVPPIPAESEVPPTLVAAEPLSPETVAAEPWITAFDGAFHATPVPPGRVRAIVRHPAYVETTSELVDLGPGGTATVRVVLERGGTIEGTVVDEAGLPVAGARVEVAAMEGTATRSTLTADDGTFAFPTLPHDVMVTVARPEEPYRAVVRHRFDVPNGKNVEASLVLPALRDPIEVEAEDDSSRPVKMAQITALSLDPEKPLRTTAFTDDAGRATIADAVGLPLRLVVEAPGFARWTKQLEKAPAKVSADLVSGVTVEGHVTSVRGRRDVAGASVELLSDGKRRRSTTDAQGLYRFTDVSPGRAHVRVSHPDFAFGDADFVIESTGRADRSFDVDAIDLVDPNTVEGHVVDGAGQPVRGARVAAGAVGSVVPVGPNTLGVVVTDGNGAFRLDRVAGGKVDLAAFAPHAGRGKTTVDVDTNHGDVTIRLATGDADSTESASTGGVAITLHDDKGPVVLDVAPNSEAERAGLAAGDRVRAVDGVAPTSTDEARRLLSGPDGSDVVVEVLRKDAPVTLRVRREAVRP